MEVTTAMLVVEGEDFSGSGVGGVSVGESSRASERAPSKRVKEKEKETKLTQLVGWVVIAPDREKGILLVKLGKGQEIDMRCIAVKVGFALL